MNEPTMEILARRLDRVERENTQRDGHPRRSLWATFKELTYAI